VGLPDNLISLHLSHDMFRKTGKLLLRLPRSIDLYILHTVRIFTPKSVTFPPAWEILNHPDMAFTFAAFRSAR